MASIEQSFKSISDFNRRGSTIKTVETHEMNLLPFDSTIANTFLMAGYAMLAGAGANVVVVIGFSIADAAKIRRN
jgi:hypothetical protein